MPKYAVVYVATVDATVEVEAEDEVEAMDKGDELFQNPNICAHCSHNMNMGDWYPAEGESAVYEID